MCFLLKIVYILSAWTLLLVVVHSEEAPEICETISGPALQKPCMFPFEFNGLIHTKCTFKHQEHLTNDPKAWCSTKIDPQGRHVARQGQWGNCGQGCQLEPRNDTQSDIEDKESKY